MTTLKRAVERETALLNAASCRFPRKVRFGSLIAAVHAGETGCDSDGVTVENSVRVDCGAVGAISGLPVCGLSHTWLASAFALRNERSSRKKTSRFLPQRNERYKPFRFVHLTGA